MTAIYQRAITSLVSKNQEMPIPGGRDCFNLSAFSESKTQSV